MRRFLNIIRPLFSLLLILQVSIVYALPLNSHHFELCFGSDGHFDIKPDQCISPPSASQLPRLDNAFFSSKASHSECLDITLGSHSSPTNFLRLSTGPATSKTTAERNQSLSAAGNHTFSFSHRVYQSSTRTSSYISDGASLSSHLIFTRTVVLLV